MVVKPFTVNDALKGKVSGFPD